MTFTNATEILSHTSKSPLILFPKGPRIVSSTFDDESRAFFFPEALFSSLSWRILSNLCFRYENRDFSGQYLYECEGNIHELGCIRQVFCLSLNALDLVWSTVKNNVKWFWYSDTVIFTSIYIGQSGTWIFQITKNSFEVFQGNNFISNIIYHFMKRNNNCIYDSHFL